MKNTKQQLIPVLHSKQIKKQQNKEPIYFNRQHRKTIQQKIQFKHLVNQLPSSSNNPHKNVNKQIEYFSSNSSDDEEILKNNNWNLKNILVLEESISISSTKYRKESFDILESKISTLPILVQDISSPKSDTPLEFERLEEEICSLKESKNKLIESKIKLKQEIESYYGENKQFAQKLKHFQDNQKQNKQLVQDNLELMNKLGESAQQRAKQFQEIFEYNIKQNEKTNNELEIKLIPEIERPNEGSLFYGDTIKQILEHSFADINKHLSWKQKQFKVAWNKRANGVEPAPSWQLGQLINIASPQVLYSYYKQKGTFVK